jgi:dienelactone hydrolase
MGPYSFAQQTFEYREMDWTDRRIEVVHPTGTGNQTFPLVIFMHGYGNDGIATYGAQMHLLASWGYVVAAPRTCKNGCFTLPNCRNEAGDPLCFGDYYKEAFKVIDWVKLGQSLPINETKGIALAGHSMGGQAVLFASAWNKDYDIRAAVMQHPYSHKYPAIASVPFLVFTGDGDTTAVPEWAHKIFNADGASPTRGIVEHATADHQEPAIHYRPEMGLYTLAWFKVHFEKTPSFNGTDFYQLLYGIDENSLCHGGDGNLTNCTLVTDGKVVEQTTLAGNAMVKTIIV